MHQADADMFAGDRRKTAQPCQDHEKRLSLMEQALLSLKQTNDGVSTKLDLILAQITKIALLEQKHMTSEVDITRAHRKVEMLEEKHDNLSIEMREFMNYTKGQNKVLWAIGAAVFALFIKMIFFAAGNGMTP